MEIQTFMLHIPSSLTLLWNLESEPEEGLFGGLWRGMPLEELVASGLTGGLVVPAGDSKKGKIRQVG